MVASIALAGAGVALGLVLTHGQRSSLMPPNAVLGQSLRPLVVYQWLPIAPQAGRAHAGEMTVPRLGQPGRDDVLRTVPVGNLHVQYARVRPVLGHWQIEFIAPDTGLQPTAGNHFDVLLDGKALTLLPLEGSLDGTNFSIGAQANWLTSTQAAAVAKSFTTSVTVAHCSRTDIDANECG
jgi:hypothetical protein